MGEGGDMNDFEQARFDPGAGLCAIRMRLLGDCSTWEMAAGDAGSRFGKDDAKPANGELGAQLCTGTFFSTEFSEGKLEAKPENGETGTDSMDPPMNWSRLRTRSHSLNAHA